jgi:hypothetical protein
MISELELQNFLQGRLMKSTIKLVGGEVLYTILSRPSQAVHTWGQQQYKMRIFLGGSRLSLYYLKY